MLLYAKTCCCILASDGFVTSAPSCKAISCKLQVDTHSLECLCLRCREDSCVACRGDGGLGCTHHPQCVAKTGNVLSMMSSRCVVYDVKSIGIMSITHHITRHITRHIARHIARHITRDISAACAGALAPFGYLPTHTRHRQIVQIARIGIKEYRGIAASCAIALNFVSGQL